MKNRTDLILGEAFCIFIFFYFLDSGLSVPNGLQFYFRLGDSENRELKVGRRSDIAYMVDRNKNKNLCNFESKDVLPKKPVSTGP